MTQGWVSKSNRFPTKYEINDYGIMEVYIRQLPFEEQTEKLEESIHGRKPFRRFRELIERFGMLDQWYKFLDQSHHDKVVAWCKKNDIQFDEKQA